MANIEYGLMEYFENSLSSKPHRQGACRDELPVSDSRLLLEETLYSRLDLFSSSLGVV